MARIALALALGSVATFVVGKQLPTKGPVAIDDDDIGGVVTGSKGPEAGVWVIAETTDTPTKLRKIVVTDDKGRYVLPDLPKASYKVWVRGYGLVDSKPVTATPGHIVALQAVQAPDAKAAAEYYPAYYWFSLAEVPPASDFPGTGTGPGGNGINPTMLNQHYWINQMKLECETCHQLGTKATREFPAAFASLGSSTAKWDHRVQTGQDGASMTAAFSGYGRPRALKMFSEWTDRIAAGELPPQPPRPQGVERNLVLTLWEWGDPATFAHDTFVTDKRNPTINANGPIYGVDWGNDLFIMVDPVKNSEEHFRIPTTDDPGPPGKPASMPQPSAYWGNQIYWNDPVNPNHGALDETGRVWFTGRFRNPTNQPAFCKDHPSSTLAPLPRSRRQFEYFDPKTRKFTYVNICFDTHHMRFANDPDRTVYANARGADVVGWVKTRVLDETGDEAKAQGWCRGYYDVNKDGKIELGVDKPIEMPNPYSVIPNDHDGSVWAAIPLPMPGKIVRIDPKTCVGEAYAPPFDVKSPDMKGTGYTPRGIDIDSKGIIWTALASSGHMASFDRSKCKVLDGPEAMDPQHCREGWTLYPVPGPKFKNVTNEIAVDYHYYNYVDQFDTLGLGKDLPIANGTTSDSLRVLFPSTGKWVTLRVPYPLNFYQRGMDGRIDDPKAGWKGRGLFANYGQNAIWHLDGGKGTLGNVVKFQMRPDPLAK
jgi:hypothetical protein